MKKLFVFGLMINLSWTGCSAATQDRLIKLSHNVRRRDADATSSAQPISNAVAEATATSEAKAEAQHFGVLPQDFTPSLGPPLPSHFHGHPVSSPHLIAPHPIPPQPHLSHAALPLHHPHGIAHVRSRGLGYDFNYDIGGAHNNHVSHHEVQHQHQHLNQGSHHKHSDEDEYEVEDDDDKYSDHHVTTGYGLGIRVHPHGDNHIHGRGNVDHHTYHAVTSHPVHLGHGHHSHHAVTSHPVHLGHGHHSHHAVTSHPVHHGHDHQHVSFFEHHGDLGRHYLKHFGAHGHVPFRHGHSGIELLDHGHFHSHNAIGPYGHGTLLGLSQHGYDIGHAPHGGPGSVHHGHSHFGGQDYTGPRHQAFYPGDPLIYGYHGDPYYHRGKSFSGDGQPASPVIEHNDVSHDGYYGGVVLRPKDPHEEKSEDT